jgi:osmoprotectant transport system permease protein
VTGALAEVIDWTWVSGNAGDILGRTGQHVMLTVLAVAIGMAISLPLGVFAFRHGWAYAPITAAAGILYTIPSIALFVVFIPVTGLSNVTVEIALVSYTLLILVRNVVAGLRGVSDDVKEAAAGMGYTRRGLLWRVELPLSLPVIMAGVRIATVSTIGLVTVAALIGKGGLGQFILAGLQQFFNTEIIVGAVLSLALALVADGLLLVATRLVTPWATRGARAAGRTRGEPQDERAALRTAAT